MEIVINGKPRCVEEATTIALLLSELGFVPQHVAVEMNCELVPRGQHLATVLHTGDRVEVVTLVGGG